MSKIKYVSLALILAIFLICSFGGFNVLAMWQYSEATSEDVLLDLEFIVMPWEGADDLPNQSETGNNHKSLINKVLNGTYVSGNTTQNIGLNTKNSYLAQEIAERKNITWRDADRLGSMDIWQSDRITEYFSLNEESNKVAFILVFPDNSDEYYLYTTSVDLGSGWTSNIPEGTVIYPVYKTTIRRNDSGLWEAVSSEIGYAESSKYSNPLTGLKLGNAFDTTSWKAGKLGTEFSNAVYTKNGLTLPVEMHSSEDATYYYFDSTSNANRTITVSNSEKAVAYVYDSSGVLIDNSAQGTQKITFRAGKSRYYIKITGDSYSTFTIS